MHTTIQLTDKRRELNVAPYVGLIDCVKAFDKVGRTELLGIMIDRSFPQHLIRAIQSLYLNTIVDIQHVR